MEALTAQTVEEIGADSGPVGRAAAPCACCAAAAWALFGAALACRWGELDSGGRQGREPAAGGRSGRGGVAVHDGWVWRAPGSAQGEPGLPRLGLLAGGPCHSATPRTLEVGVRPWCPCTAREPVALVAAWINGRERPGGPLWSVAAARCP